jgi:hypothetical protein
MWTVGIRHAPTFLQKRVFSNVNWFHSLQIFTNEPLNFCEILLGIHDFTKIIPHFITIDKKPNLLSKKWSSTFLKVDK